MTRTSTISQPSIRSATAGDLPQIERLLTSSALPMAGVRESLQDFLVAEHDGVIVGVVGLEVCCARYALLRSTAVDPAWRGRGLGRVLVERAIADAESRGIHALWLLTTTAERYFPSFGFVPARREDAPVEVRASVEFTSACPASAAVMTLPLPRGAGPPTPTHAPAE